MGIRKASKRRAKKPSQKELDRRRLQSHIKLIDNVRNPIMSETEEIKKKLIEARIKKHLTPKKK